MSLTSTQKVQATQKGQATGVVTPPVKKDVPNSIMVAGVKCKNLKEVMKTLTEKENPERRNEAILYRDKNNNSIGYSSHTNLSNFVKVLNFIAGSRSALPSNSARIVEGLDPKNYIRFGANDKGDITKIINNCKPTTNMQIRAEIAKLEGFTKMQQVENELQKRTKERQGYSVGETSYYKHSCLGYLGSIEHTKDRGESFNGKDNTSYYFDKAGKIIGSKPYIDMP